MKPFMFVVEKDSEEACDRRIFEMVRLLIKYNYTADNGCWRTATRERYRNAAISMREMVRRTLNKHYPGYETWLVKPTGSSLVIDLDANRNLSFLITMGYEKKA